MYEGNFKTTLPPRYTCTTMHFRNKVEKWNSRKETSASSSKLSGSSANRSFISFFFSFFFLVGKGECSLCYSKDASNISK